MLDHHNSAPTSGRAGHELLDLLTDKGVCTKTRWVDTGWNASELEAASVQLESLGRGKRVPHDTWSRTTREKLDEKPYLPSLATLRVMVDTLQHLDSDITHEEAELALAKALGFRITTSELNVVSFGMSLSDVVRGLVEAAGSPEAEIAVAMEVLECFADSRQRDILARLAMRVAQQQ